MMFWLKFLMFVVSVLGLLWSVIAMVVGTAIVLIGAAAKRIVSDMNELFYLARHTLEKKVKEIEDQQWV